MVACTTSNEENATEAFDRSVSKVCEHCNVSFWSKKFTRTHIEGDLVRFQITADELIMRRRKGRMIEFINYDELYFKGLAVVQPLNTKVVKFDMSEINILMALNDKQVTGNNDDNSRMGKQIVKQPDAGGLGNTLSRVLVDEIKVNFKPSNSKNQTIALTANYAKILTDTMTMRFEGNVNLEAAKCKISSTVAVWSNVHNGLFFSQPFLFNKKLYQPPAFFQITDNGKCQRVRSIHDVEYADKLDAVEDKIFRSMPMSAQLIFGLLGSPTQLK